MVTYLDQTHVLTVLKLKALNGWCGQGESNCPALNGSSCSLRSLVDIFGSN